METTINTGSDVLEEMVSSGNYVVCVSCEGIVNRNQAYRGHCDEDCFYGFSEQ